MSLATMKAKSLTMYGKTHSTKDGFSLNGPLRQPSLGENLGRSVTRTPFRGPAPMGHGCGSRCRVGGWRARICGHGYPKNIHHSCLGVLQTSIKPSVMNTKGMMESRFTGILHGTYPKSHVYRVDKDGMTYTEKMSQGPLTYQPPIQDYVKSTGRCTPYTKLVLNNDYQKYYLQKHASCTQLKPTIYKGLNHCQ